MEDPTTSPSGEEQEAERLLLLLRDGTREEKIAARSALAKIFERRGMLDEAAECYLGNLRAGTRAEKIEAREGLGTIFEQRGMLDEAAECYESNVEAGARSPRLYERLAGVYRRMGRRDLADEVEADARRLERGDSSRLSTARIDPEETASPERIERSRPAESTQPLPLIDDEVLSAEASGVGAPDPLAETERVETATRRRSTTTLLIVAVVAVLALLVGAIWVRASMDAILSSQPTPGETPPPRVGPLPAATPAAVGPTTPSPAATRPTVPVAAPGPSPAASPGAAAVPSPAAEAAPGPAAAERVRVVRTQGQGVNLRQQPSPSAARVKNVAEGAVLEVVGPDQRAEGRVWRNVRDADGATGWIASDFLELVASG